MMGATNYYRNFIKKIINKDPAEIKIERKIKIPDGYGGYVDTVENIEFVGIIYSKNTANRIISEQGIYFNPVGITQKLLCLSEEDVQEGDVFLHEDRLLRVNFVNDYFNICKQCELVTLDKYGKI